MKKILFWSALLSVFAFWWNWTVAHRGLFLYDYSIVFDGGWRIYQGQVPYRDFSMAQAPISFLLLALGFSLTGVSFTTFVLVPSLLNVIGTLSVFGCLLLVHRASILPAVVGGIMTAIWLEPPTGVMQVEQTAYVFNLLAILLVTIAARGRPRQTFPYELAAGACWAAAVWTKQNAGLFFLPVLLLALLLREQWRAKAVVVSVLRLAAGAVAVSFVMVAWLAMRSDLALAWHHLVQVPREFSAKRMTTRPWDFAAHVLYLGGRPNVTTCLLALVSAVTAAGFLAMRLLSDHRKLWSEVTPLLTLALLLAQSLFSVTALNEFENATPYLGLVFGLVFGRVRETISGRQFTIASVPQKAGQACEEWTIRGRLTDWQVCVFWLSIAAASAAYGLVCGYTRHLNQFEFSTNFLHQVRLPRTSGLYWGEPTKMGPRVLDLKKEHLEDLAQWLAARPDNFFIFPASTILYGLLQRPSPQPWLFFLEGHSFSTTDIPRLDRQALDNMMRLNIRVFVREQDSWMGVEDLQRMPMLSAWLRSSFRHTRDFGPYEVWERIDSDPIVAAPR